MDKKKLTLKDLEELANYAVANAVQPRQCCECGKSFYWFVGGEIVDGRGKPPYITCKEHTKVLDYEIPLSGTRGEGD